MTTVISFANQKGGVGKTTFSCQLAYYLRLKKRKKVLLIDMDAQGNSTGTLLGDDAFDCTNSEELFEDELSNVRVQKTPRGIDLIGTQPTAQAYDVEALPLEKVMNPQANLAGILPHYDFVIIDCPPTLGRRLTAALVLSDFVVSPQKLSGYAVAGITALFDTISQIQSGPNPDLQMLGIAVNEWKDTAAQKETLEALKNYLPEDVFKNKIRDRAPYDAAARSTPVWETRGGARAFTELKALFDEILSKAKKFSAKSTTPA